MITGKPLHLTDQLITQEKRTRRPRQQDSYKRTTRGEETYDQRCTKLLNLLPDEIPGEENFKRYTNLTKNWVSDNTPIK